MLIDRTYFDDLIIIPNVNEPDPNQRAGINLDIYIESATRSVLSLAFGVDMWEDFKTFIKQDGTGLEATAPQSYVDIYMGKNYSKDIDGVSRNCYWRGLIETNPKSSLLADYAYCLYKQHDITQTVEFGEAEIDTKVGVKASSAPKIARAWNNFLERFQGHFLIPAMGLTIDCTPFVYMHRGIDYHAFNHRLYGYVPLMQFLWDNKAAYPLFDTDKLRFHQEYKNSFGI